MLIYARNRERVLMIHRDSPERAKSDDHAGKWNGLGGKSDADESARETASREFREEAGLNVESARFQPLGVIQFPNFKAHKSEDWTVFVFGVDLLDAEVEKAAAVSEEGSLHWIAEDEVLNLNLWAGDRHFIPWILERRRFVGTIWYRDSNVFRHELIDLGVVPR